MTTGPSAVPGVWLALYGRCCVLWALGTAPTVWKSLDRRGRHRVAPGPFCGQDHRGRPREEGPGCTTE
jgi:hypothetical protein